MDFYIPFFHILKISVLENANFAKPKKMSYIWCCFGVTIFGVSLWVINSHVCDLVCEHVCVCECLVVWVWAPKAPTTGERVWTEYGSFPRTLEAHDGIYWCAVEVLNWSSLPDAIWQPKSLSHGITLLSPNPYPPPPNTTQVAHPLHL